MTNQKAIQSTSTTISEEKSSPYDQMKSERLWEILEQELARQDPFSLIEEGHLTIKAKDGTMRTLVLNKAQRKIHGIIKKLWEENKIIRIFILKARQLGASTYIEALIYSITSQLENQNSTIIADDIKGSNYIFEMSKLYQEKCPDYLKPAIKRSNEKKLEFDKTHSQILIDTAENPDAGRKYTFRTVHLCLDGKSLIPIQHGYIKKLQDIQIGDEVKTHRGKRARVVGISKISTIEQFGTDKMVEVVTSGNRHNPIICTPDHKIFVRNNIQGHKREGIWKKAKDIKKGDYLGFPFIPSNGGQVSSLTLPETPQGRRNRWRNAGGEVKLDFGMGYFVGFYLAEGTVNVNRVQIACHEKEENILHKLGDTLKPYITSYAIRKHKDSKTIIGEYSGIAFAMFIQELCGKDKYISDRMWSFPKEFLKGMIKGYVEGDGHFVKGNEMITITSIRPQLLTQIRDLLVTFRYGYSSLDFKKGGERYGRNCQDCWVLRIHGKTAYRLKKALGWEVIKREKKPSGDWKSGAYHYWIPVEEVKETRRKYAYDIALNHRDHSFRTITGCGVHNSEYAFFKKADHLMLGLSQSVPSMGRTIIVKETTANGFNFAKDEWDMAINGETDYIPIFAPWYWGEEYQMPLSADFVLCDPKLPEITKDEAELAEQLRAEGIDSVLERLQWRRWCIRNNCNNKVEEFRQEYPSTPEEAFIASGECFFDKQQLALQLKSVREPLFKANIVKENYKYILRKSQDGAFEFYAEPNKYSTYSIGGDAASGSGLDYSVLVARDKASNEVVATFRAKADPDELAFRAMSLGNLLNEGKVAIENDKFGFAANAKLRTIYGNIYVQRSVNKTTNKMIEKFGWDTNAVTRPMMLSQMQEEIREGSLQLKDPKLIRECLTFIKNPDTKKAEAQEGMHDDMVIACGISGQLRHEEPHRPKVKKRNYNEIVKKTDNAGMKFGKRT